MDSNVSFPYVLVLGLQAFGVGALEEEDDDIYHRDALSNYDTALGGEEPGGRAVRLDRTAAVQKQEERYQEPATQAACDYSAVATRAPVGPGCPL